MIHAHDLEAAACAPSIAAYLDSDSYDRARLDELIAELGICPDCLQAYAVVNAREEPGDELGPVAAFAVGILIGAVVARQDLARQ